MKTIVILAGGKSTRMGKDKIFLHIHYNKETFLEHLYYNAAAVFEKVIISAGSKERVLTIRKLLPQAEIISDLYPEKGPMGGIVSVYEQTGCEKFAVIPVDVPAADMDVLSFFWENCKEHACILKSDGDFPEPLVGAYGKKTLARMRKLLQKGNYQIRAAFSEETAFYTFDDLKKQIPGKEETDMETVFFNINTDQDYRDYLT